MQTLTFDDVSGNVQVQQHGDDASGSFSTLKSLALNEVFQFDRGGRIEYCRVTSAVPSFIVKSDISYVVIPESEL